MAFAGFAQVPLSGDGSQASPYLIRTASDWTALASYVKDNKDTFEDKFIRMENDIDLSSETFQSLWADNVTYFLGTFDGQGHRVSGIDATLTGTYGGIRYDRRFRFHHRFDSGREDQQSVCDIRCLCGSLLWHNDPVYQ